MAEAGLTPALGGLEGAYRVGLWYDPQPKDRLKSGPARRDDLGVYASVDQRLTREGSAADDDGQGLGVFARFGLADSKINEIRCFASAGAQYQGLIPGRDDDVLGLGAAWGDLSPDAGYSADNETAMELYYNLQPAPWLSISPSVQYVLHPGGDSDANDAVILGLRAVLIF